MPDAQNGVQVSFGTSARLFDNEVSLNNHAPATVTACGLLIYKAGGVSGATKTGISYIKADNNFHANETDIWNFGKGGGLASSQSIDEQERSANAVRLFTPQQQKPPSGQPAHTLG